MHLYKFGRDSEFALTRDPAGTNLPGEGEWTLLNDVSVHNPAEADRIGIGAPAEEVVKAVAENGFFIWPVEAVA